MLRCLRILIGCGTELACDLPSALLIAYRPSFYSNSKQFKLQLFGSHCLAYMFTRVTFPRSDKNIIDDSFGSVLLAHR